MNFYIIVFTLPPKSGKVYIMSKQMFYIKCDQY